MANWLQKLGFGLKKSSERLTGGLTGVFTQKKVDSQTLEELEDALLSADIGVRAAEQIIKQFSTRRLNKDITPREVKTELATDIEAVLRPCEQKLQITKFADRPFVVLMIGVNGAGKTTTIGKLAAKLQKQYQISFIAADTFRAAAVEQLEAWGRRCNILVHKGANGCDAAGLCFDGLQEAVRRHDDLVFIDTAGRLQNKVGLMDELKKIIKVIAKVIPDAPHAVLLTLDATTGQNALAQIKTFKEAAPVSGLIITKLDGSSKGGILVAMAQETAVPIHYIGVGEQIDDLDEFNAHDFSRSLLEFGSDE